MSEPSSLQQEAAMLAQRTCLERTDYLFEVAHAAHRGPDEAEQLRRLTFDLLGADGGQSSFDPQALKGLSP